MPLTACYKNLLAARVEHAPAPGRDSVAPAIRETRRPQKLSLRHLGICGLTAKRPVTREMGNKS